MIEAEAVSTGAVTRVVEVDMRVEGDMVGGADTVDEAEGDINSNNKEVISINH